MKNMNQSVSRRVKGAVFAALYVALCLALAPFCYGAVQVRVAVWRSAFSSWIRPPRCLPC